MTVGERIKILREQFGYSQVDFADKLNVSKQTLYKYENNIVTNIPSDKIEAAAHLVHVSPSYLMGWDDSGKPSRKGVVINVLGRVAAGIPINAIEDIIDTEEIPEDMAATGEFFGLQIHGNSMEPRMIEGDIVIVRQQDDAESGDIVIAMVNGDEATCKKLVKYPEGISLVSFNTTYEPMFFSNIEIQQKPVRIIGKVIELRGKF